MSELEVTPASVPGSILALVTDRRWLGVIGGCQLHMRREDGAPKRADSAHGHRVEPARPVYKDVGS
jgi:hypothetical protein